MGNDPEGTSPVDVDAGADSSDDAALKVGELPELHIAALDRIVLHEDPDMERVARLVERFSADGILKNPPVVGRARGYRPIVLDGANRITALTRLGYPHVLVQALELDDPGLFLDRWHHVVEHLPPDELLAHAAAVDGVMIREARDAPPHTETGLARFRFADGRIVTLNGGETLMERVEQLHAITRAYHRFAYFDRVSYTNMEDLARNYRHLTALVTFRPFDRDDLLAVTARDRRVPSGVTRVLLPKRALRFNLQLEVLRADLSLEEKEEWLQQTIREKVADKSIRFYREPTFFFDE